MDPPGDCSPKFLPSSKRHCISWPTSSSSPDVTDAERPVRSGAGSDGPAQVLAASSSHSAEYVFPSQNVQQGSIESLNAHGDIVVANSTSTASPSDWRMILYQDRNVVLYNPKETPPFRAQRLPSDDSSGTGGLASASLGRCPLCKQATDARFAFAAQAYFDLLQSVFRSSRSSSSVEISEEVDLLSEGDLYRILGVTRSARPDDIRRAYRKRSLRYHPDKNLDDPDAKLKFQKIAEAFTVLSDEQKRSKYDMSGVMDLDDFDVEQFMNMVNSAGPSKRSSDIHTSSSPADVEFDDMDADPAPNIHRWEVVHFTFVNVRSAKSRDAHAKILGAKASGAIFYGQQEGDWVALSDEPGYIMIRNEDQGTLLQRVGEGGDMEAIAYTQPISSENNPFLMAPEPLEAEVQVGAAVASEGGAEAEAAAVAALRHLPPGLLNTGYYARFFTETRSLGSGSFGSVFLCRHVLDDLALGDYAVKKVPVGDDKTWLRNMIREVKMFERLHHPNVVEYKHSWLELSRTSEFCPLVPFLFILMQYCNGGSLDELIWHEGNPSRPKTALHIVQVWHFLVDILQGLQHLHRQGILHRDLKPTNILLQALDGSKDRKRTIYTPRAMLSDFGTAAPFGEPIASISTRGYTGTVEYTAPELLNGQADDREYTEKSDMWSLGIVLHAMCFSALPFHNEDPHVLKRLINEFVERRRSRRTAQATPLLTGGNAAESVAAWLPPDVSGAQIKVRGGRLGSLRLVAAALLAIDPFRRPTATDLLENQVFRGQATRHLSRAIDQAALQAHACTEVIDLT